MLTGPGSVFSLYFRLYITITHVFRAGRPPNHAPRAWGRVWGAADSSGDRKLAPGSKNLTSAFGIGFSAFGPTRRHPEPSIWRYGFFSLSGTRGHYCSACLPNFKRIRPIAQNVRFGPHCSPDSLLWLLKVGNRYPGPTTHECF